MGRTKVEEAITTINISASMCSPPLLSNDCLFSSHMRIGIGFGYRTREVRDQKDLLFSPRVWSSTGWDVKRDKGTNNDRLV